MINNRKFTINHTANQLHFKYAEYSLTRNWKPKCNKFYDYQALNRISIRKILQVGNEYDCRMTVKIYPSCFSPRISRFLAQFLSGVCHHMIEIGQSSGFWRLLRRSFRSCCFVARSRQHCITKRKIQKNQTRYSATVECKTLLLTRRVTENQANILEL